MTTYTNRDIAIDFPSLPAGAVVTSISTTITYTSNYPSYTNELRIQVTPPAALGGVQSDLQVGQLLHQAPVPSLIGHLDLGEQETPPVTGCLNLEKPITTVA